MAITKLKKVTELRDEDTLESLQKKFFHIAAHKLAWRAREESFSPYGISWGFYRSPKKSNWHIEYKPFFSKTAQGESEKLADSKWLILNLNNIDMCPVDFSKSY